MNLRGSAKGTNLGFSINNPLVVIDIGYGKNL